MTTQSSTNHDTANLFKDLAGFLQSTRPDLRLEATKAVLQVATDRNQVIQLVEHGLLLPLLRVVSDTSHSDCAENALQAILYLSSSVEEVTNACVEELLKHKAISRLVELVLSSGTSASLPPKLVNSALGVLANLTRTETGTIELVGKTLPDEAVKEIDSNTTEQIRPTMELLLDNFLNDDLVTARPPEENSSELEEHRWDTMDNDPFQHFAAILMNATQVETGKKFVLKLSTSSSDEKKSLSVFERLIPQLRSPNPIRRRGISGMIRNCCLEKESAWWMLNVVCVLTPILYPLSGPEELDLEEKQGLDPDLWLQGPDKVRECDSATRQHLVESILLLCASGRQSRGKLRVARTYVILKYADMVEEKETISERINECVQFLRRDEDGTQEGSSDRMVEDNTRRKLLLLPSLQVGGGISDFDDVD